MTYTSLFLKQFRSYADFSVELSPNVNVIVGLNGSGKTNLLEALYVLSRGKSFRVADADLLAFGSGSARIEARINDSTRRLTLNRNDSRIEKRWLIDTMPKARLSPAQKLKVVLFEPRDMQLLTGSPDQRRTFMDDALEQLESGYGPMYARYRRALTQRNTLLKQTVRPAADHFFVWNVRLSELGAQIIRQRRRFVAALNGRAQATYQLISGTQADITVAYSEQLAAVPDDQLASALLQLLDERHKRDIERGFTSVGPHRDDLTIHLNQAPASTSASRGETRSLVVMLKLLEAQLLETKHNELPLVLLDDVFGELDIGRRQALAAHFTKHQVVITATEAEAMPDDARVIRLK